MQKNIICSLLGILLIPSQISAKFNPDNLFPEIANWKKPSSIQSFDPNTLWNIIDGAADAFLSYDFVEMYKGEYTGKGEAYMSLEIYQHDSPEDAFGMYTTERALDLESIQIGTEGYVGEDILNCLAGSYYIKIHLYPQLPDGKEQMKKLASEVVKNLKAETRFPAALELFPKEGKISRSESYINSNFLGYSFLSNAFIAQYEIEGKTFTLFAIPMSDDKAAEKMLEEYLKFVKSQDTPSEGKHLLQDKYNGSVGIYRKGNLLMGFYNLDVKELQEKYFDLFAR